MSQILQKHISIAILFCLIFYPQLIYALPQNGTVVGGNANATISSSANTLTVDQNVARIITDWDSFSVGELETVNFQQDLASWIALNRVAAGNDPSHILGTISALGRVFLVNPNGIVFGVNSVVDTAGLVASTLSLDMDDNVFINGTGNIFNFVGPGASVVNYGTLRTLNHPGGYVALLGSSVKNIGLIEANLGTVVLAAGEAITLNLDPAGLISVVVDITQGTDRNDDSEYAAVNNTGQITANGGRVILTADILNDAFDSAVNNDGIIEAGTLQETKKGYVLLKSNQNVELNGTIVATGAIDAYAEENIFIGRPLKDIIISNYIWNYLAKGYRVYKFKEFGYYYGDDELRVPLSSGYDIGNDSISPLSGAGKVGLPGEPTGLYIVVDTGSNVYTYFENYKLNPDQMEHLDLVKLQATVTEYWWEDKLNQGDKDFDDMVIDFVKGIEILPPPDALLDAPNIFLTANQGYIEQGPGNINSNTQETHYIKADNLMLSSNTGMSGIGSNAGLATQADNLSALNKTENHIRVNNKGTLTLADLSALVGLNTGVTGLNGISNFAVGGEVNIDVIEGSNGDLYVLAPVNSYGPVIFTAAGNIIHTADGDVTVHNPPQGPNPPTNLHSPSHLINNPYLNTGNIRIEANWALPLSVPGYGFTATAGGYYAMVPLSQIVTQGGNASITANGNVALALINAHNGNVVVTSNTSISDIDFGTAPGGDFDVIAHNIQLIAPVVGVPGVGEEIDLGHPYDFSHLWDNANNTNTDPLVDPYDEFFDPVTGDWSFANLSNVLSDGSWWFHVSTIDGRAQSDTAHLGPFILYTLPPPPPPPPTSEHWETIEKEFRVYYEILDPSQFLSFEPAKYLGLYAYHPLTSADASAFDDIKLDVAAYDFIDGNIDLKKKPAPYFGIVE